MARTQVRDADGVTRPVKRHGRTKTDAVTRLRAALTHRSGTAVSGQIRPESKLKDVAALWFAEQERLAAQGTLQMTTVDQYRDHYRRHILKAMGELRIVECTVSAVHGCLVAIAERSASTAKTCRTVLSGILGYATIHKALDSNPVRDAGKITVPTRRPAVAMDIGQVIDWLAKLEASEDAVRWDLPDLSRWLLATGVRIGEALAVSWDEVDILAGTVEIAWHLVTIRGQGLVRAVSTKTATDRDLTLPGWAVTMLKRRKLSTGGRSGAPVFPDSLGSWRDPRAVRKHLRAVRAEAGYDWLTSHSLGRKTVATLLDEAGASARQIADQLGHARVSMTQDVYMKRRSATNKQAQLIETALPL
jgi:integrase